MNIKPTAAIKYVLLFFAGVLIVYLLFKDQHFPDFLKDLKDANWFWAFLSALATLIAHLFRAIRWQLMIVPIAQHKPKLFHTFNALMIGYFTNLLLPRVGEFTRCATLAKRENIAVTALIGTVITERIIDLLMLLGLIFIALFLYADLILTFLNGLNLNIENYTDKLIWLGVLALIVTISYFMFQYFKGKSPLILKILTLINQLKDGVLSIRKIEKPFSFLIYTILIWVFYILSSYLCFRVLTETSFLNFSAALLTVIAGSFGMIAPIQGGIGAFHFMVTETLVLLNINKKTGLEYATIVHAAQTVSMIVFGIFALILEFKSKKGKHASEQSEIKA